MNLFKQWLSDIKQDPIIRKAALGVAGLAVAGGAIAGPATAAGMEPAPVETATAVVQNLPAPPRAKALDYQYKAQENYYYCGPAATRMALTALDRAPSQDEVAKHLRTTVNGTDSAEDVTRVLNELGGDKDYRTVSIPGPLASDDETARMKSDIVRAISDDRAAVVNIKGTAIDTDGQAQSYPGRHYVTVVGYDEDGDKVTIADPAAPKRVYSMTIEKLADWTAERGYSA